VLTLGTINNGFAPWIIQ